jgi:hypothetical protein
MAIGNADKNGAAAATGERLQLLVQPFVPRALVKQRPVYLFISEQHGPFSDRYNSPHQLRARRLHKQAA